MLKTNDHQLRQMFKSATGLAELESASCETINDCLSLMLEADVLRLPFSTDNVFVLPERLPIFGDIMRPKKSQLIAALLDRSAEVGLVVDAHLSGVRAVHFACVFSDKQVPYEWVGCMADLRLELMIKPVDEDYRVMIAPFVSFVCATN